MTRSGPSAADRELIAQLAARKLTVSLSQLERWRRAGLLPRNARCGRGRGRGSTSTVAPEVVEIADALVRHTRQARDQRLAVADWFAQAGRTVVPGQTPVPEPPEAAAHAAVVWITATSPAHRLLRLARSARTETQRDAFYDTAVNAIHVPAGGPGLDAAAVREALLTGQDLPDDGRSNSGPQFRAALIHLIAAVGMGLEEVGADAFSEAVAGIGLYPWLSTDGWERELADLERSGHTYKTAVPLTSYDPLALAQRASAEQLRQARTVTNGLSAFGAMYLMHALLMPDTPGLAALRARIDELGITQMLMGMASGRRTTRGFVSNVIGCLHPLVFGNLRLAVQPGGKRSPAATG